jgi:hypothetical protein
MIINIFQWLVELEKINVKILYAIPKNAIATFLRDDEFVSAILKLCAANGKDLANLFS